jgi:hypothetical protein
MNLILRPSTPPWALICSIASFSASTDPVSLIAIVPVTECRMPTVTSVSVTASPVVFTCAVGGTSARAKCGTIDDADRAAAPMSSPRRVGVRRFPVTFSEDMRRLDSAAVDSHRGERTPLPESRLRRFIAVQHTSIDVYAYVECRTILRIINGETADAAERERCLEFILLQRTLYSFCAQGPPWLGYCIDRSRANQDNVLGKDNAARRARIVRA